MAVHLVNSWGETQRHELEKFALGAQEGDVISFSGKLLEENGEAWRKNVLNMVGMGDHEKRGIKVDVLDDLLDLTPQP